MSADFFTHHRMLASSSQFFSIVFYIIEFYMITNVKIFMKSKHSW